jgi:hypothetical protein
MTAILDWIQATAAARPFALFWTAMIFLSIAWYAFLLFWLGIKGGFEIYRMIQTLSANPPSDDR